MPAAQVQPLPRKDSHDQGLEYPHQMVNKAQALAAQRVERMHRVFDPPLRDEGMEVLIGRSEGHPMGLHVQPPAGWWDNERSVQAAWQLANRRWSGMTPGSPQALFWAGAIEQAVSSASGGGAAGAEFHALHVLAAFLRGDLRASSIGQLRAVANAADAEMAKGLLLQLARGESAAASGPPPGAAAKQAPHKLQWTAKVGGKGGGQGVLQLAQCCPTCCQRSFVTCCCPPLPHPQENKKLRDLAKLLLRHPKGRNGKPMEDKPKVVDWAAVRVAMVRWRRARSACACLLQHTRAAAGEPHVTGACFT